LIDFHAETSKAPAEKFRYPRRRANEFGISAADWETFGIRLKSTKLDCLPKINACHYQPSYSTNSRSIRSRGNCFSGERTKGLLSPFLHHFFCELTLREVLE
jgi:hypothetical protein